MGEQHGWATRVAAHLGLEPRLACTMDMGGATPIGMVQTAALYIQAGMDNSAAKELDEAAKLDPGHEMVKNLRKQLGG